MSTDNTIYDVFISYRRAGGFDTAGRINDLLSNEGYSVSYDIDTLREGRFDESLLERIEQCVDFILIVDKDCFVRTLDPKTNPKEDWLRQELAYALKLKKNVIPVLLAGVAFPKELPGDIEEVRFRNGPQHTNVYFDSFYTKLKSFLHALPRNRVPSTPSSSRPVPQHCLKLKTDLDCIFYLDGEETARLKAEAIQKFPLLKGEYWLRFVSVENEADSTEMEFEMPEADKLLMINLDAVRAKRLEEENEAARKAAEEKRLVDERKREAERKAAKERLRAEEERKGIRTFTVGDVSFKMIRVDGGSFLMGSTSDDSDAISNEKPAHRVRLSAYHIGETVVTQALWKAVMGKNNPSRWKGDNLPVENVSWDDCQSFIAQINNRLRSSLPQGCEFRLPTEAQWEFAARGGNMSNGHRYAGSNSIDGVAWYDGNSGSKTHPVKQKLANELGLYDMSGNVLEWCQDWFDEKYYSRSPQSNPCNDTKASYRVLRGGSWSGDARYCRVAYRFGYNLPGGRYINYGLRLVLAL